LVKLSRASTKAGQSAERGRAWVTGLMIPITCAVALLWIPLDPLSSPRSCWSPWPAWTAKSLHCLGVSARDYEVFDRRVQLYEIARAEHTSHRSSPKDVYSE
jgi:hypothetical protein